MKSAMGSLLENFEVASFIAKCPPQTQIFSVVRGDSEREEAATINVKWVPDENETKSQDRAEKNEHRGKFQKRGTGCRFGRGSAF